MTSLLAWADEQAKIAASLAEIGRAAARTKGVYIADMRGALRDPVRWLASRRAKGAGFQIPQKELLRAIKEEPVRGLGDVVDKFLARRVSTGPDIIIRSSKTLAKAFARPFQGGFKKRAPILRGPAREGLLHTSILHEGFERAAKTNPLFHKSYHHAGPGVILREMNLVNRLTGPGSNAVREAHNRVRTSALPRERLEYDLVREHLLKNYGPRALRYIEPGSRMPRAMRKDMVRRMEREWEGLGENASLRYRRGT